MDKQKIICQCCIRNKEYCSTSPAVTYAKQMVMSATRCKPETWLLLRTNNRKSCIICRSGIIADYKEAHRTGLSAVTNSRKQQLEKTQPSKYFGCTQSVNPQSDCSETFFEKHRYCGGIYAKPHYTKQSKPPIMPIAFVVWRH